MVKPGRPFETWTSTETGRPTAPFSVAEATSASTWGNGRGLRGIPANFAPPLTPVDTPNPALT